MGEHRGGYRCHRGDVPVGSLDGLGFGGAPVAPEPGDEEEHVVLRVVARACPSVSIFHPWAVVVHGGFVRGLVCVDVETSGVDPEQHDVVEVGWYSLSTGVGGVFIPPHSLLRADPKALAVNRYWVRGLSDEAVWDDGTALREFHAALAGNFVVGSNPGFDWAFLRKIFLREGLAPLAYPPLDVPTYAAGVLGRGIGERLGLTQLCRVLRVVPGDHSAGDDVRACVECLLELQRRGVCGAR